MIRDLNSNEKPRERLMNFGAQALSDSELLAIILRSGGRQESAIQIAGQMIKDFGNFKSLAEADIKQLINYKHIGKAKACGIKAACEISLRIGFSNSTENLYINKPKDIFDLLRKEFFNKNRTLIYDSIDNRNKYISKIY
jgi:DNA repair protein RadC